MQGLSNAKFILYSDDNELLERLVPVIGVLIDEYILSFIVPYDCLWSPVVDVNLSVLMEDRQGL